MDPKKRMVLGDLTNRGSKSIKKKKKRKCDEASSIYKHLHVLEMEVKRRPLPNYAESVQRYVSEDMRAFLVDWLVEIGDEFKLTSDTLYLAVSCVDRFLSTRSINVNRLQLLGVSSLLIASKYEEMGVLDAEHMCYMTDNTYTLQEVTQMEKDLLRTINFDLVYPTPKTFLRIIMVGKNLQELEFLASYLLELSLLDYKCLKFLPSVTAASALLLSRFIIQPNNHPWNLALQCQTGYKPCDLKECVLAIQAVHSTIAEKPFHGVREKYLTPRFNRVASLAAEKIPASYLESIDE